jgi:hypothetical protein
MEQTQESKLPVDRILEISAAVVLIEDNKYLSGKDSYALGRLGDATKSIARSYTKARQLTIKKSIESRKPLIKELKNSPSLERKAEIEEELATNQEAYNDELTALGEQLEYFKAPTFNLSSFIAKEDIVENEKVVVRKGQTLVPVKFFTCMGELIIDDEKK